MLITTNNHPVPYVITQRITYCDYTCNLISTLGGYPVPNIYPHMALKVNATNSRLPYKFTKEHSCNTTYNIPVPCIKLLYGLSYLFISRDNSHSLIFYIFNVSTLNLVPFVFFPFILRYFYFNITWDYFHFLKHFLFLCWHLELSTF